MAWSHGDAALFWFCHDDSSNQSGLYTWRMNTLKWEQLCNAVMSNMQPVDPILIVEFHY